MIKFLKVIFKNFMAYGNNYTEFDLTKTGTTLILGKNGVGKTTIMNAIVYALYNRSMSKVNVDELINDINQKNMEVIVEFEKDNHHYVIERVRKGRRFNGKDTWVKLTIDGKDETPANIEEKIAEIIGMPHDTFVRVVVISALHSPFLELKSDQQRSFIENLFDLTFFSELAKKLQDKVKNTKQYIQVEESKIEQINKNKTRHEQQVLNAQARVVDWEKKNQQTIQNLETNLKSIENIDWDKEVTLHLRLKEINEKLTEVLREQRTLKTAIEDSKSKAKTLQSEIKLLSDKKCPFCLQAYKASEEKVVEHETKLRLAQDTLNILAEQLKVVDENVPVYTQERTKIEGTIKVQNLDKLLEIKNQSQNINQKLEELRIAENPHIDALEELQNIVLEEPDYTMVNDLNKLLEHQQFMYKLLTKSDSFIRKEFINLRLPYLNKRLKEYLEYLQLPFKVEFTSDLSASITRFGRAATFPSLSNGQAARVNLGLALSFRDTQAKVHPPINLCLLDEVFDLGLDDEGVELATQILKKKAREENINMFIISHRGLSKTAFDNAYEVVLDKDFSVIKSA